MTFCDLMRLKLAGISFVTAQVTPLSRIDKGILHRVTLTVFYLFRRLKHIFDARTF